MDTTFDESYAVGPINVDSYAEAVERAIVTGVFATRAQKPPAGTDPRLVPPLTVRAAMMRADFDVEHGWRDAMTKEVRRVERFKAWELFRFRQFHEMRERFPGRDRLGPHVQGGPQRRPSGAGCCQQVPHLHV